MVHFIILMFFILCFTFGIKEVFGDNVVVIDEESERQHDIEMEYMGLS